MQRPTAFEVLEQRRLLAASVVNGVLTVTGNTGPDLITVSLSGSSFSVRHNSNTQTFPTAGVGSIVVNALDGDDVIQINSGVMGTRIDAGIGNDTLTGGDGNDTLLGGTG